MVYAGSGVVRVALLLFSRLSHRLPSLLQLNEEEQGATGQSYLCRSVCTRIRRFGERIR